MTAALTTARPSNSKSAPDMLAEQLPPHNIRAEVGVLSALMQQPDLVSSVMAFLPKSEAFYDYRHTKIYETIVALYSAGKPINAVLLYSEMKKSGDLDDVGGIDYITEIARAEPTAAFAENYAAHIAEDYQKRKLITTFTKALRTAYSGENAAAIQDRALVEIFDLQQRNTQHQATMAEVMHATFEQLQRAEQGDYGLPLPFTNLQNKTMGLHGGESVVIAGRPGTGKSSFAQAIVEQVSIDSLSPKPALVFSLEMSFEQWGLRMISARSGVPISKIRRGQIDKVERDRMNRANSEICNAEIYFDKTPGIGAAEMRSKARRLVHDKGIALIAIDYLQLMNCDKRTSSREQEVAHLSQQCKQMAQDLNVPVLVLCQLNRASEIDKRRPRSSDLRESGSLEQDADLILLLHREWKLYENDPDWQMNNSDKEYMAEALIAKQRNGECGIVPLVFYGPTTRYMDPSVAIAKGIKIALPEGM